MLFAIKSSFKFPALGVVEAGTLKLQWATKVLRHFVIKLNF